METKKQSTAWPDTVPAPETKPKLKLSGSDGNAFMIIGKARREAESSKWTMDQIEAFTDLAQSGDYDNVLRTCMKYFDVW